MTWGKVDSLSDVKNSKFANFVMNLMHQGHLIKLIVFTPVLFLPDSVNSRTPGHQSGVVMDTTCHEGNSYNRFPFVCVNSNKHEDKQFSSTSSLTSATLCYTSKCMECKQLFVNISWYFYLQYDKSRVILQRVSSVFCPYLCHV